MTCVFNFKLNKAFSTELSTELSTEPFHVRESFYRNNFFQYYELSFIDN